VLSIVSYCICIHVDVQACPESRITISKGRRRMGQECPFEGRIRPLRADVLVSLRRWRRRPWPAAGGCFGVRQGTMSMTG
jgi:hypothetical protein